MPPPLRPLALAASLALLIPAPGTAQFLARADSTARRLLATRAELSALAQALDSVAAEPRAGVGDKSRAGPLAARIRTRLESTTAVFAGELRTVHDLLYRPQQAMDAWSKIFEFYEAKLGG